MLCLWRQAFISPGGMCTRSKTLQIVPADGRAGSRQNSGMPKTKVLDGGLASDRAKQRRALGTLRELTVQPATKRRYNKALDAFFVFLKANNLSLPTSKQKLDPLVCDYIEHMWSTGIGRAQANDTVAALQDQQPNLKGHLHGAWRLLKTWSVNEVPNRAPPLPEQVVLAMAGWAFFHGHYSFGVSLIIGFYTMLRSGELLGLSAHHIMCSRTERQALISLGFTKGGKRQGAAESVILGVDAGVRLTQHWKSIASAASPLVSSPIKWRALFSESLQALGLEHFSFRPYSLRRGGATWWFSKHQNLERILVQGRWAALKTARIYLNEGLAMLARTQIDFSKPRIASYLNVYHRTVHTLNFSTLEPSVKKTDRAGGRGRKNSKRKSPKTVMKRAIKKRFSCRC